jgi:hypothetical protein
MRKIKILIAIVALAVVVGIPTAVMASSGGFVTGSLNWQRATFTTTAQTVTSSKTWVNITGLDQPGNICATGQVTGTLSVQLTGAPAGFKIFDAQGGHKPLMQPGEIRFVPAGSSDSASFTFVANATGAVPDFHAYDVQWHSATGKRVTLTKATFTLQYDQPGPGNCGG